MLSKTLFTVAFTALSSVVVAASPPGCLLGAVNTYDKPADIKAVCESKDIASQISKKCGSAAQEALSALAEICNGVDVKVSTKLPSTASGSASPSGTGSAASTGAAAPSGTGSPSGTRAAGNGTGSPENTAGPTPTPSGPAEQAGNAAGRMELSAAALLAGLGVFMAAL